MDHALVALRRSLVAPLRLLLVLALLSSTLLAASCATSPTPGRAPAERLPAAMDDAAVHERDRSASASERAQPASASAREQSTRVSGRDQPVLFIENVGQFAAPVRFQAPASDRTIWLTDDGIWVALRAPRSTEGRSLASRGEERGEEHADIGGAAIKLSFVGANPAPRLEPFARLATTVSYLIGNDPEQWRSAVPAWGGVRYSELYPGIDLEVGSAYGRLAPRLVVREEAGWDRLADVRLRVEGADVMGLTEAGLWLRAATGDYTLPLFEVRAADGAPVAAAVKPQVVGAEVRAPVAAHAGEQAALHPEEMIPSSSASDLLYATFLGGGRWERF